MPKRTPIEIPERVHTWIDFGLDQASKEVVHNDEHLVSYVSRYSGGSTLHTMIGYAVEEGVFRRREFLLVAVFDEGADGSPNQLQMKDELPIGRSDDGMVLSMAIVSKCTACTRAVADVLGYGQGIPFKRDRPVERTTVKSS